MKMIKLSFLLLFLIISCEIVKGEPTILPGDTIHFNKSKDTTILVFDPSKLTPVESSKIIDVLSELAVKNDFVIKKTVEKKDNPNLLIKHAYNIVDENDHHISEALLKVMRRMNKLSANMTLIEGSTISMPRLPVKRSKSSTTDFTQYFDFYNNKSYFSSTMAIARSELSNIKGQFDFKNAGLFAFKFTPRDLASFKDLLGKDVYKSLYGRGLVSLDSVKMAKVKYLEHNANTIAVNKAIKNRSDTLVAAMLKGLDRKNFGIYYIFDSFNGSSDHGQKVIDVINDRFLACGIDTTGLPIMKIPINFFDNIPFAQSLLKDYYSSSQGKLKTIEETHELGILDRLDTLGKYYQTCADCIPEIYLSTLFRSLYRNSPDVISSSFWANMIDRNIMPRLGETVTNLVTAGLNDPGEIEDRLKNVLIDPDVIAGTIQPLYDYFIAYGEDGCMIIGNRMNEGVFHGSFGKHVTTLGQGLGWSGSKIHPTDSGTSFATPDVATKLYIAKAYWKSKQFKPLSPEARLRVLLATDIDTSFIGKFESGGTLNLSKLLQIDNYAELQTGEIVPVLSIDENTGSITSPDAGTKKFRRRYVLSNITYDGICGLTYCQGRLYSFSETTAKWQPEPVNSINLTIKTANGSYNICSKEDFYSKFKQLIILKNP